MAENKTKATSASVEDYIAAIADDTRREDCRALAKLISRVTKYPPTMWGTGIVGFGSYHYKYESGREGDSCLVGFASRKSDISIYLHCGNSDRTALLAKLGKHKMGKGCLYLHKLSDIDNKILEQLVAVSVAEMKRQHG